MGGGLGGWRRRLCGAALSLRRLFCQPSATDQQSASQPCTDLIPLSLSLSLYFCLPLSRSPLLPEALAVPMSPSYANCLSCYQRCMSVWQPLCLLFCLLLCMPVFLPASLSIHSSSGPPVCLLLCLFLCVHACLPVHLPVCLPATFSSQYLAAGKWPGCQPLCQSACLSACLFVICVCLYLFACSSICLFTCLHVHLFICLFYSKTCLSASKCFVKWQTRTPNPILH